MEALTTIALVLDTFTTLLKSHHDTSESLQVAMDPTLNYIESMKGIRTYRSMFVPDKNKVFPLFVWSRGTLQRSSVLQKRGKITGLGDVVIDGHRPAYKVMFGEFELRFAYIAKNMADFEQFEVNYVAGKGIHSIHRFDVDLGGTLADFRFTVDWQDLGDIEFNKTEGVYLSAAGSAIIAGPFLVIEEPVPVILEIIERIRSIQGALMSEYRTVGLVASDVTQSQSISNITTLAEE